MLAVISRRFPYKGLRASKASKAKRVTRAKRVTPAKRVIPAKRVTPAKRGSKALPVLTESAYKKRESTRQGN